MTRKPKPKFLKMKCPTCNRMATVRPGRKKPDCHYCRPPKQPERMPTEDEQIASRIEMHARRTVQLRSLDPGSYRD